MDMNDVIALVNTNRGNGKKENLNRMKLLMEKLENPQNQLKYIHVAGTNGKGTTSSFIASILREAGFTTGLYISPHLEVINERIRINNTFISNEEFIRITERVEPLVKAVEEELDEILYSFEILTAVALLYFAEKRCDIIVLETGIGGRLDATNVIHTPEAAVITSIGMDHTKILGHSLENIAKEKAGIIKEEGNAVLYPAVESIQAVFQKRAQKKHASLKVLNKEDIKVKSISTEGQSFQYKNMKDFSTQMIGRHQIINACLAIEAVKILQTKGYPVTDENIRKGIEKTIWAGRMEKLSDHPLVFIDGAHNEQGVEALKTNIEELFAGKKVTLVVGMMKDKAYMSMIEKVEENAEKFFLLSPDRFRGFDASEVAEKLCQKGKKAQAMGSVKELIQYIHQKASDDEIIIVFGSLYLVGDLRKEMYR